MELSYLQSLDHSLYQKAQKEGFSKLEELAKFLMNFASQFMFTRTA
jgi:hypothetical protein